MTQRIAIAGKILALTMVASINATGFGLLFFGKTELGINILSLGFMPSVECLKLTRERQKRNPE
ncbi:MAG: hypothetical protein KME30_26115 [Iphinoe sp. HA4291-MV1]|nr:hypothetical protein [Iphinoe sp. HA4291-MV1]